MNLLLNNNNNTFLNKLDTYLRYPTDIQDDEFLYMMFFPEGYPINNAIAKYYKVL